MIAIRFRTEYLKNPLGIDVQHPRLFWHCEGGIKQTAYQIVCEQWDSGKVTFCQKFFTAFQSVSRGISM